MGLNRAYLLTGASALALFATQVQAEPPSVVASIKPVHALVAGVMEGIGTPSLIVDGERSPHTFSLRPSDARALQEADVIFWVGPGMEAFLDRPIDSLGDDARVVTLMEAQGLRHVAFREGGVFEAHAREDNEGHRQDDDDHAREGRAERGRDDDDHAKEENARGEVERNAHIWLDPENAKAMTREIAEALSEANPENTARYAANADALVTRLDGLSAEMRQTLAPVRERPFIVFHDAYQHLEQRFGLNAAGSVTVSPEVIPGAERVASIRRKIAELGATCVFSEPQFTPRLVDVVTEGTAARAGVLDPLGTGIPNGPEFYFTLMRNMAASMRACLSPTG